MAKSGRRPCRPGSRERATEPHPVARAVDEDHVVEQIDRLEAEDERRIAVLLEDDGRRERRLETVRRARAHDATEAAQRLTAGLGVVRQGVEPRLHRVPACAAAPRAGAPPAVSASAGGVDRISARERARR